MTLPLHQTLPPSLWIQRFRARIIQRADLLPEDADSFAELSDYAELSEGFENDPVGAADREIAAWPSNNPDVPKD